MPAGSQPSPDSGPENLERRRFFARLSIGLSALVGVLVGGPVLGYLLSPLIKSPQPRWVDLGPIDDYQVGDTRLAVFKDPSSIPWAGLTAQTAAYVRRTGAQAFTVFSVHCTHLGCPVNWLSTAQLFFCPCHGGVFYRDGTVAAGPPSRPLFEYRTRLDGGHLFIQTQPLAPTPPQPLDRLPMIRL